MSIGWAAWSFPLGVLLDALIGDPRGWPHPVRAIGWLIRWTERVLRKLIVRPGAKNEKLAGVFLTLSVVSATAGTAWGIVALCDHLGLLTSLIGRAILIHFGLAARSLRDETLRASEATDLTEARRQLAMIVGRDTENLDWPDIHRACVETVAENANDGVIAVIFWYAIAGPVGIWAYKAINTLDSMIGYRNDRYQYFGWASARLDDVASFLPARLSWLFFALAAGILGENAKAAIYTGWRDSRKHVSPNSAWSEATVAGALGVQLGGPAIYQGVLSIKPLLGESHNPIGPRTVQRSIRLMVVASLLSATFAWLIRVGLFRLP